MKTAEELFEELDGSPCPHDLGNGWQCFRCAIEFFKVIQRDAIEAAARLIEQESHYTPPFDGSRAALQRAASSIRALVDKERA